MQVEIASYVQAPMGAYLGHYGIVDCNGAEQYGCNTQYTDSR